MRVIKASSIALLFAVLLGTTDHLTYPIIMENKIAYENREISEMVADRDFIATENGYKVYEGERLVGFVKITSTNQGYNGEIHLLVAYDITGKIIAVRITEHRETPGLGDAIEGEWINTFRNRQIDKTAWALKPKGDFDSITGASITSRAVIKAVAEVLPE